MEEGLSAKKPLQICWTLPAKNDFISIMNYVSKDSPKAVGEIAVRVEKAVELISEHPAIGRIGSVAGTREWILAGLPYFIPYRVAGNMVEILRIYHASRNWPDKDA